MALVVEEADPAGAEAETLREQQEWEALERYGEEAPDDPPAVDVLLVVRDGEGRAVACGGLRGDEVDRLFVRPYARGAGVGRLLLTELEARARAAGRDVLRAQTTANQPEAAALFATAGWSRSEDGTRFERRL